jgi:aminopeptidase-like protein
LFWGTDTRCLTAIHFAEQQLHESGGLSVPYRFKKLFAGRSVHHGAAREVRWIYFVRVDIPNTFPDLDVMREAYPELRRAADEPACDLKTLHTDCLRAGVLKQARLGSGSVACGGLEAVLDVFKSNKIKDPWRYLTGPPCDLLAAEYERTGRLTFDVVLESTDLKEMISKLAPLPRHLVSDGYDAALLALRKLVPLTIHRYPTGTEAFTWIVPERWLCRAARLEKISGEIVFSEEDHPLHVVSYSLPVDKVLRREELLARLHVCERDPEAIPFVFKYYERDWGLCCAARQRDSLTDPEYRVVIDTDFSYGELKVGEWSLEGRTRETFVFCAHLCHPGQLNDGLSGVLAGLKLFELLNGKSLNYSYKLLILPETIGSAAWLSHNEAVIPHLRGGIFLEMLASPYPNHTLMASSRPGGRFDRLVRHIVKHDGPDNRIVPYLTAPLNDERMFNDAGIHCPMLALYRLDENNIYPEYHTSKDDKDYGSVDNISRSVNLLHKIVEALENDSVPVPLYKGELFISRFLSFDYKRQGQKIRKISHLLDGESKISDIAQALDMDFFEVRKILQLMEGEALLEFAGTGYGTPPDAVQGAGGRPSAAPGHSMREHAENINKILDGGGGKYSSETGY